MLLSALPSLHPTPPWWAPEGAGCPIAHQKEAQPVLPGLGSHWGWLSPAGGAGTRRATTGVQGTTPPMFRLGTTWAVGVPSTSRDAPGQILCPGGPGARCPHSCWGQHPPAQPPLTACPRPGLVQKALPSTTGCPCTGRPPPLAPPAPCCLWLLSDPLYTLFNLLFFFFFLLPFANPFSSFQAPQAAEL